MESPQASSECCLGYTPQAENSNPKSKNDRPRVRVRGPCLTIGDSNALWIEFLRLSEFLGFHQPAGTMRMVPALVRKVQKLRRGV